MSLRYTPPTLLLLLVAVVAGPAIAAGPAGKVLFATGRADIVDTGRATRPMVRGEPVWPGETLVTADGRAQVRMTDGSSFSLERFTRLHIDDYLFEEGVAKRAAKAFYSLLRGGFRTISGQIGKSREEDYSVSTVVADIGIRGTTYRALLCQGDCAARPGDAGKKDGLHVNVSAGRVFLRNDAGVLDVNAGQSAFVAGRDVMPTLVSAGGQPGSEDALIPGVKPDEQYQKDFTHPHPEPAPHPEPEPYPGPQPYPESHPHP